SGRMRNKWVAFFLCLFFGELGVHKFYEGKVGMGFLYMFTLGLFGIGWFVDLIVLLCKPNPYSV
ncbi:MAG: TM2 domain-containing protein, partial [Oscillospiraceae bacterium]